MAKKRFTIMLEEKTIAKIKELYKWYTPVAVRELIESLLKSYTSDLLLDIKWRKENDK